MSRPGLPMSPKFYLPSGPGLRLLSLVAFLLILLPGPSNALQSKDEDW